MGRGPRCCTHPVRCGRTPSRWPQTAICTSASTNCHAPRFSTATPTTASRRTRLSVSRSARPRSAYVTRNRPRPRRSLLAVAEGKRRAAATLLGRSRRRCCRRGGRICSCRRACAAVRCRDAATLRVASAALADLAARNPGVAGIAGCGGAGSTGSAAATWRRRSHCCGSRHVRCWRDPRPSTSRRAVRRRPDRRRRRTSAGRAGVRDLRREGAGRQGPTGAAADDGTATRDRLGGAHHHRAPGGTAGGDGHTNKSASAELFLSPSAITSRSAPCSASSA